MRNGKTKAEALVEIHTDRHGHKLGLYIWNARHAAIIAVEPCPETGTFNVQHVGQEKYIRDCWQRRIDERDDPNRMTFAEYKAKYPAFFK